MTPEEQIDLVKRHYALNASGDYAAAEDLLRNTQQRMPKNESSVGYIPFAKPDDQLHKWLSSISSLASSRIQSL